MRECIFLQKVIEKANITKTYKTQVNNKYKQNCNLTINIINIVLLTIQFYLKIIHDNSTDHLHINDFEYNIICFTLYEKT